MTQHADLEGPGTKAVTAHVLQAAAEAGAVRGPRVIDGPFTETKEMIVSFAVRRASRETPTMPVLPTHKKDEQ